MNREHINQYNSILLLRTKNRVADFHKPTGITKLIEKNYIEGSTRKGYDNFFEKHLVEAKKTRNIRGLFRVPDNIDDNHLIVEAKPQEKDELEEHKDLIQLPREQDMSIPKDPRQIDTDSDDSEPEEGKDPIERYDEGRMSINDYIELARKKPGRDIGVVDGKTRNPMFVINYDGQKVKIYQGREAIIPWFRFFGRDIEKYMGEEDYPEGVFDHDKIEQIRLANFPVKFKKEDLPEDTELITEYQRPDDDDDDDDRGGSKIRNSKDFIRQYHKNMMEIEKDKEIKKKIRNEGDAMPLLVETRRGNDDDDDQDQGAEGIKISKRSPSSSEEYKNEIENLRVDRDKLWQQLQEKEALIPEIHKEFEAKDKQLEEAMAKMKEELQLIKDIESSAKEDYRRLKVEYDERMQELQQANLSRRNMEIEIKKIHSNHYNDVEKLKTEYAEALRETQSEINNLKEYYEGLLIETRREIEQAAAQANNELRLSLDKERTETSELRTAMNELKLKYLELENARFKDIEELTKIMERQREDYSEAREFEVSELKQHLKSLESEKNAIPLQYDKLINDYQTSVNVLKNKDKEIESIGQKSEKGKQEIIQQAEEAIIERDQIIQDQKQRIEELAHNIQRLQQQYDSEKLQLMMTNPSSLPLFISSKPIKESTEMEIQYPKSLPKQEETKIEVEQPKPRKQEVINIFDRDYGNMKTYKNQILERKDHIKNMTDDEKQEMQNALTTAINFGNNLLNIIPNNNAKFKLNAEISTWINELNRIRANDDLRIGASAGTRSQGPVLIGEEIQTNFLDEKGNLIYRGKIYQLAGKEYTTLDYVINLIMHAKSHNVKAFKDAFVENQKNLGDTVTYNNPRYVNKAIEILNDALGNDPQKVAIMMKHIIDKYPNNIYKEFKTKYNNEYENLIPKKA